MDHRQFQMCRRIIDRYPRSFRNDDRHHCQKEHDKDRTFQRRPDLLHRFHDRGQRCRPGDPPGGKKTDKNRRFDQRGDHRFPAASHSAESASRIKTGKHHKESSQSAQRYKEKDIPRYASGRCQCRDRDQQRSCKGGGKNDIGSHLYRSTKRSPILRRIFSGV